MKTSRFAVTLNGVVLAFSAIAVWLYVSRPDILDLITQEDSYLEFGSVILYVGAAILFLGLVRHRAYRHIWALGLAGLMIFVAGEELAWGQRLLGLETPAQLAAINVQHQLTVHNLDALQGINRLIALLFILSLTVAVPLVNALVPQVAAILERLRVPIFPFYAIPVVVIAALFMIVPRILLSEAVFALDEVAEFLIPLAFLVYAAEAWSGSLRKRDFLEQGDLSGAPIT